jgi:putative ABC transport system substrate-binding protein
MLLGGAAAAWPFAARAKQIERVRRIGFLDTLAADDPEASVRYGAFLQGLQALGWAVGRNLRIDARWAAGDTDRIRRNAVELVGLAPDVILASGFSTIRPLLDGTRNLPIVFVNVVDPVGGGLVASLARPGGNITGFTTFEFGISIKWLELLKQIAPGVTRAAVLRDPTITAIILDFRDPWLPHLADRVCARFSGRPGGRPLCGIELANLVAPHVPARALLAGLS